MHRRTLYWLKRVPVEASWDRRNAVAMQIVLIIVGTIVPLVWLERLGEGALQAHEGIYFIVHGVIVCLSWLCLFLIRLGGFRVASALFLIGFLLLIMIIYSVLGINGQWSTQITHVFPLALAGVIFGRRALWLTLLFIYLCVLSGVWHELRLMGEHTESLSAVMETATGLMVSFLIVAVVFDCSVAGLHTSLIDISEQRRELELARRSLEAEKEEREDAMEQLMHVQKVKAIGQLAGGVAHDFNNILGVILGYAQWRERRPQPDALKEALAGVENAARRGAAISRKLLSFSRHDVGHPEVFDSCEALRALEGMLRQLFDPRVCIELDLPTASLPIRFDRGRFELAVLNVATNARDAMPEGGCFRIQVRVRSDKTDSDQVEIRLQDTGVGMDETVRRRIFEPFFTTKSQSSGTGLGLAVVGKVIGEAGGDIQVESAPGRGSCFSIRLPRSGKATSVAPTDGQSPRVLLVDDDDELRALLASVLEEGGCRVLSAKDGREAWRVIERGNVPDVLVTDYRMPGLDGLALINRIKPSHPEMAMVLISDYMPDGEALARDLPPDVERLPKPFSPDLLLKYVFMLTTWSMDEGDEGEGG